MSLGPMRTPRNPAILFANNISTGGTFNSGIVLASGAGFEHAAFQIISPSLSAINGFSVTIYGTLDPNALLNAAGVANTTGGLSTNPNGSYPAPGGTGAAWFPIPAPSEQSGTGTVSNPLTALNQVLETKVPCLAFWVQVVATTPSGSINVVGWTID